MDVKSLAIGSMAALQSQPLNAVVSSDMPTTGKPVSKDPQSDKAVQTSHIDSTSDNKRISPLDKQRTKKSPDTSDANISAKPSGMASHVVVTYNSQGKMRTKFLDSRNNVVYQVPPEMVAKMEDLMMKPETSTNIKG